MTSSSSNTPYSVLEDVQIQGILDQYVRETMDVNEIIYLPEDLYYAVEFMLKATAGGNANLITDRWNPNHPPVLYWQGHQLRAKSEDSL